MDSVDLVVTGDSETALAATIDAVRCGCRVLLVLHSGGRRAAQRARAFLRQTANTANGHLTVMTNAKVVCVDGVGGVEAVVIRYTRTGRLCAVNTQAFLSCGGSGPGPPAECSGQ